MAVAALLYLWATVMTVWFFFFNIRKNHSAWGLGRDRGRGREPGVEPDTGLNLTTEIMP